MRCGNGYLELGGFGCGWRQRECFSPKSSALYYILTITTGIRHTRVHGINTDFYLCRRSCEPLALNGSGIMYVQIPLHSVAKMGYVMVTGSNRLVFNCICEIPFPFPDGGGRPLVPSRSDQWFTQPEVHQVEMEFLHYVPYRADAYSWGPYNRISRTACIRFTYLLSLVNGYLLDQFRANNFFTHYALRKMTLTRLTPTCY